MAQTVLFWSLLGILAFGFALAVQMRIMVALVLRRALKDRDPAFEDRNLANAAVVQAAGVTEIGEGKTGAAAGHLRETYPNPLRHLNQARRASVVLPAALIGVLALGRLVLGVI